ncbi:MAG: ferrous iron transporter B [Candidatus Gygaella obscura]|nr:ferrous iron transporter B [Candidatus Gygaella obscura]
MKIVLIGNPNVGKSVIFSRITGVHVIASNYPGTTVELAKGWTKYKGEKAQVIDLPGIYTLEFLSKADEIAVSILKEADIVINIIDATNLERNLNLTLQLIERGFPLVLALNLWDETKHRGVEIDINKLEMFLNVPVVSTVGITGEGVKHLFERAQEVKKKDSFTRTEDQRWEEIGKIVDSAQKLYHHHHTFRQVLEEASVKPVSGFPIALLILFGCFKVIRFIGEGLITYLFEPLFNNLYLPLLMKLSALLSRNSFFHDILIGKLINGEVDFLQSFGLLSTGFFVPLAMVLPYIIAFYFVLGILEDIGYLPRFAVLLDNLMHRLGLHGYAIIPNFLGLGCNVPGLLATRILESKRERFIASTLILIGVPCAALQAMIIGLVGRHGGIYVAIVYGVLFLVWLILGLILNKVMKGFSPPLLIEVPPYRLPLLATVFKKLWMRVLGFSKEALPIVFLGILVVNIFYYFKVFDYIAIVTAPVIKGLLGLPKEAVVAIMVGFLRKDVAVGMLSPLSLTAQQSVIGSVVLAMFFPCIASFTVFLREFGFKAIMKVMFIMFISAIGVGSLLNLVFTFLK